LKTIALAAAALIAASTISPALADTPKKSSTDVSIPFVSHGGVKDWRATDDPTVYIQSQTGQSFKAETVGICLGLNFADRIGFDAGGTDTFDKFSRLIVRGQPCPLQSFTRVDAPPSRKAKTKKKAGH
jgi:hypothetical protein